MNASSLAPVYQVEPFHPDEGRRFDGYKIPTTDRYIPVAQQPWPYRNEAVRTLYAMGIHGDEAERERKLRVKEYKAAHYDFFCASVEEQANSWTVRDDGRIVRRWH